MTSFAVAFFVSMAVAAVLTPLVLKLALRFNLYDQPGDRKVHTSPIPRLGGIAIVIGFFAPVTGLLLVEAGASAALTSTTTHIIGLYVGGLLIAMLGIYDDLRGANALQKLIIQVGVAIMMYALDYRIDAISNPFGGGYFELGALSMPITVLWFVGVINAVNLIDGLDGLAGGIGLVAVSTLFAIGLMDNNVLAALFCACLAGALVGFLFFNFNPARIFMGDTGSLFLGFVLAAFSISTSAKGSTTVALMIPALALGLPIVDTFLAIGRRVKRHQPIFSADQDHIHHRLLRAGLSHRQAVLTLYVVALVLAGAALLLRVSTNFANGLVVLVVAVMLFALLRLLAVRGFDIRDLDDPFEDGGGFKRADLRALTDRLETLPTPLAAGDLVTELALATDVIAVAITHGDAALFAWSRDVHPKDAIRGMKLYQIPLEAGADGAPPKAMLSLQFADGDSKRDLAVVVPWELAAPSLRNTLARFAWQPMQQSPPEKPASMRPFLAVPGIAFAEPKPQPTR